ncbi:cytochrome P450 2J3-like [Zophobas morio]|uniref:cytochrome P450 2J3-like n=1 Tax=Zophobas morio TaxID=2755281 RepID=UPI0030837AB4
MVMAIYVLIITILILLLNYFRGKKHLPGPWNLPIVGCLHKLDPKAPHLTLTQFVKKYGPVYGLKLGLINVVVIADAKILKKVLIKDESVARPPLFMTNTAFQNKGILFTSVERWKDQRKFVTNFLKMATRVSPNKKKCEALITQHAENFVQVVKNEADCVALDPSKLVTHFVGGLACVLLLGKPFSLEDTTVTDLARNLDDVVKTIAFGGPLNFLPFLRFLPQFRRTLATLKDAVHKVRQVQTKLVNECEKSMHDDNKDSVPSLVEAFLLQMSKDSPKDIYNLDQLHYLIFDVFIAFTETTTTSLLWVILYLAQYHEVQNKVRQEIFDVLRTETVEINDFANLHYTKATIAEIARIRTVVPLGAPHCASDNICIEGLTIPKGAMIMPLLWAIHMDPSVYEMPEEFRPERFLDDDGKFFKPESFVPFSCGKRMCVGEGLAQEMTLIFVANVLKNFIIEHPESCPIDLTYTCGASITPKPQKVIFKEI